MTDSEDQYMVRLARADELERLQDIELAAVTLFAEIGFDEVAASDPLPMGVLQDQQREGLVWVATDADDRAVGFAAASEMGDAVYVEEISVHPAHGRRGIGRLLVETLCDWADASGYQAVTLSTFLDVPWNAPFYSRLGFRALDLSRLIPVMRAWLEEDVKSWAPLKRVYMRRELQN